ncbi:unnamed protein product [Rhizophagus irregularis]|nr:unnamed protein product [Rhizophagus irregularis]
MNLASIIFDNIKVELSKVNIGGMDMNYNEVALFLYNNNFMNHIKFKLSALFTFLILTKLVLSHSYTAYTAYCIISLNDNFFSIFLMEKTKKHETFYISLKNI